VRTVPTQPSADGKPWGRTGGTRTTPPRSRPPRCSCRRTWRPDRRAATTPAGRGPQHPQQVPGRLGDPATVGIGGHAGEVDPATVQFDEAPHLQPPQPHRIHGEPGRRRGSQRLGGPSNARQVPAPRWGAGVRPWRPSVAPIAVAETPTPRCGSSPLLGRSPQVGFSLARWTTQLLGFLVQRWPAPPAVRGGPGAGEPCAGASPAASPASQQARPARARQHPADRVEQGPVGGLQPASWELAAPDGALVAQHQELKVRGAITAGHQPEQLDGAAQRQGGKVRYHPGRPPKDRQRPQPTELSSHTNQQVTGRIRVSVPFTVMLQSTCDQRNQTTRTRRR
jgi:hypothetical protein